MVRGLRRPTLPPLLGDVSLPGSPCRQLFAIRVSGVTGPAWVTMVPLRIEKRWHRQGRWVWSIIAVALVLSGCSGNVSETASTTTTAASAPLSSAVVPEAARAPADVTAADLLTAEVPWRPGSGDLVVL